MTSNSLDVLGSENFEPPYYSRTQVAYVQGGDWDVKSPFVHAKCPYIGLSLPKNIIECLEEHFASVPTVGYLLDQSYAQSEIFVPPSVFCLQPDRVETTHRMLSRPPSNPKILPHSISQ